MRPSERSKQAGLDKDGAQKLIGNFTSQIFANIYLNEFDQFVKHELKVKYCVRYTDDFGIASDNEYALRGGRAYKHRKVSRRAFEAAAPSKESFCAKIAPGR